MNAVAIARSLSRRSWFVLIAACCALLLGYGLVLQHVDGLDPCPLCLLQRYGFVLLLLLALLGAGAPRSLGRGASFAALAVAVASAGVAAWHVYLQLNPPEFSSCGPGLGAMLSNLPFARALPKIFAGSGECTAIEWRFLGLTIPGWSLIWFLLLAAAAAMASRRAA
jgi:disulfide bond formation protein DsbB